MGVCIDSLVRLTPKFEEMEKNLTGTPEMKQHKMQTAIRAEMERLAVETLGEKGRALVEKLAKQGG